MTDKIKEIFNLLDFAELVSKRTNLKRTSDDKFRGLSPFTNEKTPSFFVNNSSKTWWCFSLGAGGGVLDYVQRAENLDRRGAIRFLAEYVGVELNDEEDSTYKLRNVLKDAHSYFLLDVAPAIEYMVGRGFKASVVKKYGLGYVGSADDLVSHLEGLGHSLEDIIASGVGYELPNSSEVVSRFKNRVMIPIKDLYGGLISFTGRDVTNTAKARYLHGPVTALFQKKSTVWNLDVVRGEASEKIIVCEGQMDAISVCEAGIPAVSVLGANLSVEQLEILSKVTSNIYVIYDSDEAGERGLLRSFKLAQEADVDSILHAVILPSDMKDPEEFINEFGVEPFIDAVSSAESDTSAIVKALIKENYKDGSSKAAIAKQVINELRDSLKQTFTYRSFDLIERIAQEFSFTQKELREWLSKGTKINSGKYHKKALEDMSFQAPIYERRILLALLDAPNKLGKFREAGLTVDDFESFLVNKIVSLAKINYDSEEYFEVLKDNLSEEDYYKTLEMYTLGLGDIDFDSALQIMKLKVVQREKSSGNKPFLGRPMTATGKKIVSTVKEIMNREEKLVFFDD